MNYLEDGGFVKGESRSAFETREQPSVEEASLSPVSRGGTDTATFDSHGYPKVEREVTYVAPGAYLRFKNPKDQAACVIAVRDEGSGGPVLTVDASRCEHDSHIIFEIPKTSALLANVSPESSSKVVYRLVGGALVSSHPPTLPIRGVSLIGYGSDGAQLQIYAIRKKIKLVDELTRHKIAHDFAPKSVDVSHYALSLRIAPGSGPFYLSMTSVTVQSVSSECCGIQKTGSRIYGKFPETVPAKLVLSSSDVSVEVPMTDHSGCHVLQSEGRVFFDISGSRLRRFLPTADRFNEAFVSLWNEDGLEAGYHCILPSRAEAMSSAELMRAAVNNSAILAAARSELRRGRNCSTLALLERLREPDEGQERTRIQLGMRALVSARRFEEAIGLYEAVYPRPKDDVWAFSRYIEACASSNQLEKARAELKQLLFGSREVSPELLARLYRYSPLLPDRYRDLFAAKLLSVAKDVRPHVKSILHVGHNFASRADEFGLFEVVERLESFELTDTERSRIFLLKAQLAHSLGRYDDFLSNLNDSLVLLHVEPVSLDGASYGFALDQLTTARVTVDSTGPLVSVIMTAFNSEASIRYALNSILSQSHGNLELLVVDDASVDRTREIIAEIANRDSRVVPILAQTNAGTYVCKNLALGRARGEFITCHDSDDWAHPRKIATSVARLQSTSTLVATGSQVVRFSPTDGLQFRRDYIQPDAPSLMYRADPVRSAMGYYDSVRAAADTEFERRMKTLFGQEAVRYGEEVLTLASWSGTTLTGGGAFGIDNASGMLSRPRNDYSREFIRWHEKAEQLYMDFPMLGRPFPAPGELLS